MNNNYVFGRNKRLWENSLFNWDDTDSSVGSLDLRGKVIRKLNQSLQNALLRNPEAITAVALMIDPKKAAAAPGPRGLIEVIWEENAKSIKELPENYVKALSDRLISWDDSDTSYGF